jgi:hypothetical protein
MFGYTGLVEPPERQAALVTQLLELVRDGRLVVPIEVLPFPRPRRRSIASSIARWRATSSSTPAADRRSAGGPAPPLRS